ncbi:MAG: tetratricopeptide repeat protein [Thermoplasmata archaeon]|nr:tetratricopeptide repeat protein [Thermoplasmata archaeon]
MERFPLEFVDREKELSALKLAMENAKLGRGSTVLVTGEIGVGKTRLAEEFAKICEKEGFTVLSSMCIGSNEPAYLPVLTVLQNYAKKASEQTAGYVPLGLAGFQSFEIDERTPNALAREQTRMLEYLLNQFTGIAKKQPVILMIDDLHLADSATLAFFHYLARNIKNERIVAVATFIREQASTESPFAKTLRNMNIERLHTVLELGNFSEKEIQVIAENTGVLQSKEIAHYIYEKTSGNPLFVVEFLAAIRSLEVIDIDAVRKMELPDTVKDTVRFRVLKLEERTRKVLSGCAILGRMFEYSVLAAVAGVKEEELLDAIETLISQNFLSESDELEEGYKFVSNTIQEVVYEDLTAVRKRFMHQKAAEAIENLHSGDEKFWSILATHYKESGNRTKFLEYAIKAGRSAARKFANSESMEFLEEVLEVLGESGEEKSRKVALLWEIVDILELEGKYDEAVNRLQYIIANTDAEQPVEAGRAYRRCCEIHTKKGEYEKAFEDAERAEKLLSAKPDGGIELARVFSAAGNVFLRVGNYEKALRCLEKAIEVFERIDARNDIAKALNKIGVVHWHLGKYEKALEFLKKSQELHEMLGDIQGISDTNNNIGIIYWNMGEYEKALGFFIKGLELREKIGDVRGIAGSYHNMGVIYDEKGDYDKALEFYRKSLELEEKIGNVQGIAVSYNNIGEVYGIKGEYKEALQFYMKSLELREKIGDVRGAATAYNNIGEVYGIKGEYEKALQFFAKSLELREKIRDMQGIAMSYGNIGLIYNEREEYGKALEWLEKSLQISTEIGEKYLMMDALGSLVECYLGLRDFESCRRHLAEMKKVAGELGQCASKAAVLYIAGKLLSAEGKLAEAEAELKKAVEIYESIKRCDVDYYRTVFELGRVSGDKGLLEKALGFFERVENKVWAERVRRELGGKTETI